ncbi:MAG: hypothetical protein L0Z53_19230 [Acidobacteriales bacterium]|nr:hypothetical protein [Terriglobales bacterium]
MPRTVSEAGRPSRPRFALNDTTFWVLLTIAAIGAFALRAIRLGVDSNWDLQNYHLYVGYAVSTGRIAFDHNAAELQSHLNPTLDLLLTWPLFTHGGLLLVSTVLGGLHGLNFVLLTALSLHLLRGLNINGATQPRLWAGLAALLGMSGAIVVSEIGTTMGDLTTALLVLSALLCCMHALSSSRSNVGGWLIVAAGIFSGLAAGLKLTNGVFIVSLLATVGLFSRTHRIRACILFSVGAFGGILTTHGWWSWKLWQWFGSPLFPFFNNVFHSPFFPMERFVDARFFPGDSIQAFAYPFFFSWNSHTAEVPFRDFRYPIAYLLLIAFGAKVLWASIFPSDRGTDRARWDVAVLSTFVVLAYVVWQIAFSIQRYAIALELLLPALSLALLLYVWPRRGLLIFIALTIVFFATTRYANWGRLYWRATAEPIIASELRRDLETTLEHSAVVLAHRPLAYIAALVDAPGVVWFGDVFNEADARRASEKLSRKKQVFAITRADVREIARTNARLAKLGLPSLAMIRCREFETMFHHSLLLCAVGERGH